MNWKSTIISHLSVLILGAFLTFMICKAPKDKIRPLPDPDKDTTLLRRIQSLEDSLEKVPVVIYVPGESETDTVPDTMWVPQAALPEFDYSSTDSIKCYYNGEEFHPVFGITFEGFGVPVTYSLTPIRNMFETGPKDYEILMYGAGYMNYKNKTIHLDQVAAGMSFFYKRTGLDVSYVMYPVEENVEWKLQFGFKYNLVKLRW